MLQVIPNYFTAEEYAVILKAANDDEGYKTVDYSGTPFPSLKLINETSTLRRYVRGEPQATTWHSDEVLGDWITIVGVQKEGFYNGGTLIRVPDEQSISVDTDPNIAIRFPAAWMHCRYPINWDGDYPRQIYVLFERDIALEKETKEEQE